MVSQSPIDRGDWRASGGVNLQDSVAGGIRQRRSALAQFLGAERSHLIEETESSTLDSSRWKAAH